MKTSPNESEQRWELKLYSDADHNLWLEHRLGYNGLKIKGLPRRNGYPFKTTDSTSEHGV